MPDELDASFDIPVSPAEPPVEIASEPEVEVTLGNEFLHGIPDQDRPIVAKYIKDWDGNVTKRFQKIHDEYRPYKELGDVEAIQRAINFQENFRQSGDQVFANMFKHWFEFHKDQAVPKLYELLGVEGARDMYGQQMNDEGFDPGEPPDPRDIEFSNMQQELEEMRAWRAEQTEAAQMAEAQKQLDNVMRDLHNAHGDFDDTYVITQMAAGANPQQAIEAYQNLVSGIGSRQPTRTPFKTMGGQGGVPSGQVDVTKLGPADRKAAVQQMLANLDG